MSGIDSLIRGSSIEWPTNQTGRRRRSIGRPKSRQKKAAVQLPVYPDDKALHDALSQLAKGAPLVTSLGDREPQAATRRRSRGERFLLQGGDSRKVSRTANRPAIAAKLKILLQMSLVLSQGARKRRLSALDALAGQYAKPRSAELETREGDYAAQLSGRRSTSRDSLSTERTPDHVAAAARVRTFRADN